MFLLSRIEVGKMTSGREEGRTRNTRCLLFRVAWPPPFRFMYMYISTYVYYSSNMTIIGTVP